MSNPESIFPKGSIAYENEQKQNPSIKSEAEAETFFPKTSIAYQNEVKANRVTPGVGKGFLPPIKKQTAFTSTQTANICPENMYWPPYDFTSGTYINTKQLPDDSLRNNLKDNQEHVMFLTLEEAFKVLQSWGWKDTQATWKSMTTSTGAQIMINYGVNGKDIVTTSMIIAQFNVHGIKATKLGLKATFGMKMSTYYNKTGTEMIKLSGYSGLRRILTGTTYRLDNPKVVQLGIGKYGLANSIKSGTVITIFVAAGFRILDYAFNDEVFLTDLVGSLATDVVKIGISSAVSAALGAASLAFVSFVAVNLAVVVAAGLVTSIILNELDEHYGITPKVIELLEKAQQEAVEKAEQLKENTYDSVLDLAGMLLEGVLETGKEVIESEVKRFIKKSLNELTPKIL
ncbi:hypothetical protein P3589_22270 [Vibrio parahaemolyticus]|nr:hypothetical protein [Vibrio parahaemolyticus]